MSQAYRVRPSSLVGIDGVSWTGFQLDSACMALADDWEARRSHVLADAPRDPRSRLERAWDRFMDGRPEPGMAAGDWMRDAQAASRQAKARSGAGGESS